MERKRKRFSFGPGFLVTAAFIGPGTVTTCSIAGAKFGNALLFTLVFATVTTIILQEMSGRLSLISGLDLAESLRRLPNGKILRMIYAILTISAITFGCAAYEAGNIIGGSIGLEMITSIPQFYWSCLISLAALFILYRGRYRFVEKLLIVLVFIMSISFITTVILVNPDFISILKGIIPSFPGGSLFLVLALIGTTVVPYNLFLHSSAVKEKWKTISDLKELRKDLLFSITIGGIISCAIVITAAAAFFSTGTSPQSGSELAVQLKPLLGPLANIFFGIGFFAAGMSSAITAPYAAAFATSGVLGWKGGQQSAQFKAVWSTIIFIGLLVSALRLKPLSVIIFAQFANGIILPVIVLFLLISLNSRKIMGNMKNKLIHNLTGLTVTLIVATLGIWSIIKLFII